MINIKDYAGMKVLVTGASGYIGSELVCKLCSIGCEVIALSRTISSQEYMEKTLFKNPCDGVKNRVKFICGDVSDKSTWDDILTKDIDVVFHLAAVEYTPNVDAKHDIKVNAFSVLYLLQSLLNSKYRPMIVFASSINVFGNTESLTVDENTVSMPLTEWSAHKQLAENYLKIYNDKFEIASISLRIPNIYGPTLSVKNMDRMVVNRVVKNGILDKSLILNKNKDCYRDYVFIDDIVDAFLSAGLINQHQHANELYVIGNKDLCSIKDVWGGYLSNNW